MSIKKNVSLKNYHTFGIEVFAENFIELTDKNKLIEIFTSKTVIKPIFVIGRGSNILFKNDYPGTILKINNLGIEKIASEDNSVIVRVSAGENWDDFVEYCLKEGYYGIENLSLIPGTVGGITVGNAGAYGVEAGEKILKVEGFDKHSLKFIELPAKNCRFKYRDSIFKSLNNKYIVTEVFFKLSTIPDVNTEHSALKSIFSNQPTPYDLRNAIIKLRNNRFPVVKELGNAGSFFKNPVVSISVFNNLKKQYPDLSYFVLDENNMKVSAGWLIEKAGWKGKSYGKAGVWDKHALIIVNHNGATPNEIVELSEMIHKSVKELFDIDLEREVVVV